MDFSISFCIGLVAIIVMWYLVLQEIQSRKFRKCIPNVELWSTLGKLGYCESQQFIRTRFPSVAGGGIGPY